MVLVSKEDVFEYVSTEPSKVHCSVLAGYNRSITRSYQVGCGKCGRYLVSIEENCCL